jgi:hypothetical protein
LLLFITLKLGFLLLNPLFLYFGLSSARGLLTSQGDRKLSLLRYHIVKATLLGRLLINWQNTNHLLPVP